jgi:hypothetical protein
MLKRYTRYRIVGSSGPPQGGLPEPRCTAEGGAARSPHALASGLHGLTVRRSQLRSTSCTTAWTRAGSLAPCHAGRSAEPTNVDGRATRRVSQVVLSLGQALSPSPLALAVVGWSAGHTRAIRARHPRRKPRRSPSAPVVGGVEVDDAVIPGRGSAHRGADHSAVGVVESLVYYARFCLFTLRRSSIESS